MTAVILTIHVLIVLALIGVVLLQRSDGGALGIGGGGGGGGGFMTGRGAANALTRTTSFLAALFFATSLGLAIFAKVGESDEDVIEELTGDPAPIEGERTAAPTTDDLLDSLGGGAAEPAEAANENVPLTEQEVLDSLGAQQEISSPATTGGGDNDKAPEEPADDPDASDQ